MLFKGKFYINNKIEADDTEKFPYALCPYTDIASLIIYIPEVVEFFHPSHSHSELLYSSLPDTNWQLPQ